MDISRYRMRFACLTALVIGAILGARWDEARSSGSWSRAISRWSNTPRSAGWEYYLRWRRPTAHSPLEWRSRTQAIRAMPRGGRRVYRRRQRGTPAYSAAPGGGCTSIHARPSWCETQLIRQLRSQQDPSLKCLC